MENIDEFIRRCTNDLSHISYFLLACNYKDICLKNYKYTPKLNNCNQIIHEWSHNYKDKILNTDIIRDILVKDIYTTFSDLQNEYLQKSRHIEPNDEEYEKSSRNIKKLAEICISINNGKLYKEFIDCYKNGYFT